jgi:hypothetical protein
VTLIEYQKQLSADFPSQGYKPFPNAWLYSIRDAESKSCRVTGERHVLQPQGDLKEKGRGLNLDLLSAIKQLSRLWSRELTGFCVGPG